MAKNIFKSIKLEIQGFFENIKQIKIDKKNWEIWKKEIQAEIDNPNSNFHTYKMNISDDYKTLSAVLTIPENFQIGASDAIKYSKLNEESFYITKYIQELNWGEYFYWPKYYYVESELDENDKPINAKDQVSCTYLAVWDFLPIHKTYNKFKEKLIAFFCINAALLGSLITALIFLL